jgi:hypothetical protein
VLYCTSQLATAVAQGGNSTAKLGLVESSAVDSAAPCSRQATGIYLKSKPFVRLAWLAFQLLAPCLAEPFWLAAP